MIVTVCMNPAIDKTVEIESLVPGGLNRIQKVEYDAGGKGINVSKTIHALGGTSVATGFLGGNAGKMIEHLLKEQGISCDFVYVDGETRTNTKVFEKCGAVTELNEPGPSITEAQLMMLVEKLSGYADKQTLFVLSGSVPKGVPAEIYGKIITLVHEKDAKVLLDADGELFRQALPEKPEMIKPNKEELQAYAGISAPTTKEDLRAVAEGFLENGIQRVAVSMGSEGALFVKKGFFAECPALSVEAHSTVGAGDAMVAAMAYAWEEDLSEEETIRLCMAASAGAVTTIGTKPPKKELVEYLKTQVKIYEHSIIGSF
jgi:1-phosphofructokinase